MSGTLPNTNGANSNEPDLLRAVQVLREEFEQAEKDGLDDGTVALVGSVAFIGIFLGAIVWQSIGYTELAALPLLVAIGLFVFSRHQRGRTDRSNERRRRVEAVLRPKVLQEGRR